MHVILPPLEEFTPADLREGRASRSITRNNALNECAAAITRAGGTVSHGDPWVRIELPDGLVVKTNQRYRKKQRGMPESWPARQPEISAGCRPIPIGTTVPTPTTAPQPLLATLSRLVLTLRPFHSRTQHDSTEQPGNGHDPYDRNG